MRQTKELKLYGPITGLYVATLLIANVVSQKIFALGPFSLPGGTVVIPLSFIFGDLLVEVYGFERSRTVIWTGFAAQALAALTYLGVGLLPPTTYWHNQLAYDRILGVVPRIVISSIVSYWFSEFTNSWILSRMKYRAGARGANRPGRRFFVSTAVAAAVDSVLFMFLAFWLLLPPGEILWTAFCLFAFKVAYEALALPLSVAVCSWIKRVEELDHFDDPRTTNYSPFSLYSRRPYEIETPPI